MANMAEVIKQIWQRVYSGGKAAQTTKRHQEEQDTDSSEEFSKEQDEHTTKRRRLNHQGDTISVVASQDKVRELLKDIDYLQKR